MFGAIVVGVRGVSCCGTPYVLVLAFILVMIVYCSKPDDEAVSISRMSSSV